MKINFNYIKVLRYSTILSASIFLATGCAVSNKVDTAMTGVDQQGYKAKTSYDNSKFMINNSYTKVVDNIYNVKDSLYESTFLQFFIPDNSILQNRKRLVAWEAGKNYPVNYIIKQHLKKTNAKVDVKGLNLAQKVKILNEYFFDIKQKEYARKFLSKYPKPKFNQFKTDRENINLVNNYKYQLNKSKNNWKLSLNTIKIEIASKTLSALYGKPKITNMNYDPNSGKVFTEIISSRNGFAQKISFKVGPNTAQDMQKYKKSIKPKLYFTLSNDSLELVGASLTHYRKQYLVKFTTQSYKRVNNIKLVSQDLNLEKLEVDYKVVSKDVEPPSWFYTLNEDGKTIGYGMGDTQEEAKNIALKEITQSLGIDISSQTSTNKKSDGNNFSSRTKQNVNISTKKIKLKGTKTIKSQKKDGIWFLAVSY